LICIILKLWEKGTSSFFTQIQNNQASLLALSWRREVNEVNQPHRGEVNEVNQPLLRLQI